MYENATTNLGSAGNLARRLDIAAGTVAEWCYCVNHDGFVVNAEVVQVLLGAASQSDSFGAIYPMLRFTNRNNVYNSPRTTLLPYAQTQAERPKQACTRVSWSSSNGALYSLAPCRKGLRVWADLWMGWEDLGYGGLLQQAGWPQTLVRDVCIDDDYEYRGFSVVGLNLHVADKPVFYDYYNIRNIILIGVRLKPGMLYWLTVFGKLLREHAVTVLARDNKAAAPGSNLARHLGWVSWCLRQGTRSTMSGHHYYARAALSV